MTKPNNDLLAWCHAHEWGRNATFSPSGRTIHGLTDKNGQSVSKPAHYGLLRQWAGYPTLKPLLTE